MAPDDHRVHEALLRTAYERFGARDIDGLFALMTDDVEWPDVANGAVLHGTAEIRPYWEAQFAAAEPVVVPTGFVPVGTDLVAVVDQRVLAKDGSVLVAPHVVHHRYAFRDGRVRRMRVLATLDDALAAPA